MPAPLRLELSGIGFQTLWRVRCRIDAYRDHHNLFANSIAKRFLDLCEVAIHRQTRSSTGRKERIDYHNLSLQEITIQTQLRSVLVYQQHVREIFLRSRLTV